MRKGSGLKKNETGYEQSVYRCCVFLKLFWLWHCWNRDRIENPLSLFDLWNELENELCFSGRWNPSALYKIRSTYRLQTMHTQGKQKIKTESSITRIPRKKCTVCQTIMFIGKIGQFRLKMFNSKIQIFGSKSQHHFYTDQKGLNWPKMSKSWNEFSFIHVWKSGQSHQVKRHPVYSWKNQVLNLSYEMFIMSLCISGLVSGCRT